MARSFLGGEFADWATSIVPILKPDVLSEFYVDYRITIAPRSMFFF